MSQQPLSPSPLEEESAGRDLLDTQHQSSGSEQGEFLADIEKEPLEDAGKASAEIQANSVVQKPVEITVPQRVLATGLMEHDGTIKRAQTGQGPIGGHAGGGASFVTLRPHGRKTPKTPFHSVNFPPPQIHPHKKSNYIRTTKYTIFTFIPLNLYFQVS